ncbi:hypothetical protein WKV53_09025 [Luteolibacter sp. Y139]|uniref:EF-hand domain-containing protein n=2 Tax=Luteolibacter soli TaxID=3135280 RepID=A0ABU9ASE1_9BACT
MKTKLPWMVVTAVLLAACDEKQEPKAAAQPKPASTTKRFTPDKAAAATKPAPAPVPEPEAEPVDPAVAQETPPPAATPAPQTTPQAPTLTPEEAQAKRNEARQQRIARVAEQMTTRLKQQDANGDGLITQNELTGPMQRGFTRADTNKDGSLDATEQQAMVQSISERMANPDNRRDRGGFAGRGGGGFGGGGGRGRGF